MLHIMYLSSKKCIQIKRIPTYSNIHFPVSMSYTILSTNVEVLFIFNIIQVTVGALVCKEKHETLSFDSLVQNI